VRDEMTAIKRFFGFVKNLFGTKNDELDFSFSTPTAPVKREKRYRLNLRDKRDLQIYRGIYNSDIRNGTDNLGKVILV
jgi:hypothetical protein